MYTWSPLSRGLDSLRGGEMLGPDFELIAHSNVLDEVYLIGLGAVYYQIFFQNWPLISEVYCLGTDTLVFSLKMLPQNLTQTVNANP